MTADAAVLRPDIKHVELLFEPMRLGRMTLPHRIAMAPLTRSRARQPGNVPKPLNASYYVQRASAAVIISEATQAAQRARWWRAHRLGGVGALRRDRARRLAANPVFERNCGSAR